MGTTFLGFLRAHAQEFSGFCICETHLGQRASEDMRSDLLKEGWFLDLSASQEALAPEVAGERLGAEQATRRPRGRPRRQGASGCDLAAQGRHTGLGGTGVGTRAHLASSQVPSLLEEREQGRAVDIACLDLSMRGDHLAMISTYLLFTNNLRT